MPSSHSYPLAHVFAKDAPTTEGYFIEGPGARGPCP